MIGKKLSERYLTKQQDLVSLCYDPVQLQDFITRCMTIEGMTQEDAYRAAIGMMYEEQYPNG